MQRGVHKRAARRLSQYEYSLFPQSGRSDTSLLWVVVIAMARVAVGAPRCGPRAHQSAPPRGGRRPLGYHDTSPRSDG
eukprot:scaffold23711_cov133-Isochrysis_galbana.AAC.4